MATLPAADERAGVDGWLRLAIALRRPRRITGLDDAATLRWVLPLVGGIWTLGIGAFVAALAREDLLEPWRVGVYLVIGPFLALAIVTAHRAEMLPGFLAFGVVTWVAALSVTTPFYYFAGGIIGTAVTAALVTWFGTWRGAVFALITIIGQAVGGLVYDDPLVIDRLALLALSMAFVVLIVGGVADRTEAVADERDLLLERFSYLSHHDVLTGLANRRALELAFDERPDGGPTTLALFDVDEFKLINDTAGHAEGDQVLRGVADRLRSIFPDAFVGRLGGDEFVVVIGDEATAAIHDLAREAFTSPLTLRDGRQRRVEVSVGIARDRHGSWSLSALLSAADQELYRMKHTRRGLAR